MDFSVVLIELAEKVGLLASAALLVVLVAPLRAVILGQGRRRDKLAVVALGLGLSFWGALLGLDVSGEHINLRGTGILIAAVLGGPKTGLLVGFGGGLFAAVRSEGEIAPWVLLASLADGWLAGLTSKFRPALFRGGSCFSTSAAIQALNLALVGCGLFMLGEAGRYLPAWPAHVVKVLLNSVALTLFVSVAHLVVSREHTAAALGEARLAAEASALRSLRQRLEPHFLFNALNALRATIRRDPEKAREMVSDLADLYRYLLRSDEHTTVGKELEHAKAYLAIEQVRLGEQKLRINTLVEKDLYDLRLPSLILQPLVENAVNHGVMAHQGPGTVSVRAHLHGQDLCIEVEDCSEGAEQRVIKGAGIALETLKERLRLLYQGDASLRLVLTEHGALSLLKIPIGKAFS